MNILDTLKQLRDDIKAWVTVNLNALNAKIDEKTIPIDSELSTTSTNPVQNKTITEALNNVPRFSGDYNDLTNAPNIAEDDSGSMVIADESGNVIFRADADGMHTTTLTLNGEAAATENYVDEAIGNIDFPETDLTGYATETYVEEKIAESVEGYATEAYVEEAISGIDFPETDLTDYYTKSEIDNAIESAKEEISESIVSENSEWKIVDGNGNIIFSVDADGAHTTELTLNGESVETMIEDRVAALVDSAPSTLNTLNELAAALGDDPNFATTIASQIGNKVEKEDGKVLSSNDFTDEYKDKLDNMEIEETDPTVPAWAKQENPPALDQLQSDPDHRTVSDMEISKWNAKSDFSGNYEDLENAPNIVEDDSGNLVISDAQGNIIFRSDAEGFETTNLVVQNLVVNGMSLADMIKEEVKTYVDAYMLGGEW